MEKFSVIVKNDTEQTRKIGFTTFNATIYAEDIVGAKIEADLFFGGANVMSIGNDNTPCEFDLWYDGKLPNEGGFKVGLFRLYMEADNGNKEKLAKGFPEVFAGSIRLK